MNEWITASGQCGSVSGVLNDARNKKRQRDSSLAAGELPSSDRGEVMQFAGPTAVQNDIGLSL